MSSQLLRCRFITYKGLKAPVDIKEMGFVVTTKTNYISVIYGIN